MTACGIILIRENFGLSLAKNAITVMYLIMQVFRATQRFKHTKKKNYRHKHEPPAIESLTDCACVVTANLNLLS